MRVYANSEVRDRLPVPNLAKVSVLLDRSIRAATFSSSAGLGRPQLHLVEACLLDVLIRDGTRWAGFGASRLTLAKVALDDFACRGVIVDCAERTRDGANLAANTQVLMDDLDARLCVRCDCVYRAGLLAPCFGALGAGVGNHLTGFMEIEDPDARLSDVEFGFIFIGTRHFALLAAGAFSSVDDQGLQHSKVPPFLPKAAGALFDAPSVVSSLIGKRDQRKPTRKYYGSRVEQGCFKPGRPHSLFFFGNSARV